ncbi:hypothetical protein MIMGU_mgv1a014152mg [Erythranthe guttata]|uniref:Uncharacterized protein n=1 Tax=Erythranthe guttata TaxID=4155 RepID=A0A022R4T7_ERYGU|nr:hypothetical protein MIMGU_mgv1a014152mg [Erythranthe guttata]
MTSILARHPPSLPPAVGDGFNIKGSDCRILCFGYSNSDPRIRARFSSARRQRRFRVSWPVRSGKLDDGVEGDDESDEDENLEKIVGVDDSRFSGIDLATLIRNKYGRSYDVQLIKKEFMGRNLLAMNVMWKYMEQRSFPLTEEEYILRLDDVATNLRCWGAVSHVRSSLEKSKERPRIGKAVSIFIDMDESGGRANEWI